MLALQALVLAMQLLTVKEAAAHLGISVRHVRRLIDEADVSRKSRWKFGREIIDLTPRHATRRTLRINPAALLPPSPQSCTGQ